MPRVREKQKMEKVSLPHQTDNMCVYVIFITHLVHFFMSEQTDNQNISGQTMAISDGSRCGHQIQKCKLVTATFK